ncbi:hypothetical protein C8R44DRAFT_992539 [Mycena epipterygia]|nr:hypothetical protein C8R44DRAFT_992539 [Mycena epipterygia]
MNKISTSQSWVYISNASPPFSLDDLVPACPPLNFKAPILPLLHSGLAVFFPGNFVRASHTVLIRRAHRRFAGDCRPHVPPAFPGHNYFLFPFLHVTAVAYSNLPLCIGARTPTLLPLLFISLPLPFWSVLLDATSHSQKPPRLLPHGSRFINALPAPICTVERIPNFDGPISNSRGLCYLSAISVYPLIKRLGQFSVLEAQSSYSERCPCLKPANEIILAAQFRACDQYVLVRSLRNHEFIAIFSADIVDGVRTCVSGYASHLAQ